MSDGTGASRSGNKYGVLERDHTTALALSIFLGLFGIDQFYLGKTGKGILKLFTLGLFGILWVIDIIMIATKSVNNIVWKPEKGEGNWIARHKILAVFIALFILGIIMAATSSGNTKNTSNTVTTAPTKSAPANNTQATTKQAAAPSRQVKGTATTLGAGTFTGGTDVAVGLYDVTPGAGQSGNFSVSGTDEYNEILGGDSSTGGVPRVRVQISKGDKIDISGLSSVAFTPVTAPFVTAYAPATLYAGTFTVGEDIGAGRSLSHLVRVKAETSQLAAMMSTMKSWVVTLLWVMYPA